MSKLSPMVFALFLSLAFALPAKLPTPRTYPGIFGQSLLSVTAVFRCAHSQFKVSGSLFEEDNFIDDKLASFKGEGRGGELKIECPECVYLWGDGLFNTDYELRIKVRHNCGTPYQSDNWNEITFRIPTCDWSRELFLLLDVDLTGIDNLDKLETGACLTRAELTEYTEDKDKEEQE